MKKYKARKGKFIYFLLFGLLLIPLISFWVDHEMIIERPWIMLPLISPVLLILWILLDTSYAIEGEWLKYRSAFNKGKIDIRSITEIRKNETMWVGLKPAIAKNGIILKYGKYDEIYLAPLDNDQMISDLKNINPLIKVSN
ncbi:PH domain-containing protein [Christiangramia aquimixticola]|uniref:PH domain-containing protein n=1 Tax=Christiangramia aquimixticola TaxID=1697558 RepID=UPI003AA95AA5